MFNNKFRSVMNLILCFALFLSLGNVSYAGIGEDFNVIYKKVTSVLTDLLVSFGDGVLHIVMSSIGELVTIDRLVFNDVQKVSIDYWNDMDNNALVLEGGETQEPIKAFMEPVVIKWYSVFFKVAIMVYMIVLVYIGISILISSTADKKTSYKEYLTSWVIGLAILFMFPYVLKYIILLNNGFVKTLKAKVINDQLGNQKVESSIASKDFLEISELYGDNLFLNHLVGVPVDGEVKEEDITDMMIYTRYTAQKNGEEDEANITLAIVYLILIGQMLALLIMYYKRAFMIGFLITIFPLVGMTYVLDKIGDGKNQSFNIWFKEFVVNVIVQMFHAVVYLLVTGTGIRTYIESGGRNLIFMFISVLFLFEGERILRSIFGIKSSANTLGDLADSGAVMLALSKKGGGLFKRGSNDVGSREDKQDIKNAEARNKARINKEKANNEAAMAALEENESGKSYGEYQGKDREPKGVSEKEFDGEEAQDAILAKAMKNRLKAGGLTRVVNATASATGATLAGTQQMSLGKDKNTEKIITSTIAGKSLGRTVAAPIAAATNKLEQLYTGHQISEDIRAGKYDKALGLDKLSSSKNVDAGDALNAGNYEDKKSSEQDLYREALARFGKAAGSGGEAKGQIKYYNYIEKETRKDK